MRHMDELESHNIAVPYVYVHARSVSVLADAISAGVFPASAVVLLLSALMNHNHTCCEVSSLLLVHRHIPYR
jgi:hypothetical protein